MSAKEDNSTSVDTITLSKMTSGAMVSTAQYRYVSDITFDEYVKGRGEGQLTKTTVDGKPAYNFTMQNIDGTTSYSTIIDIGNGKATTINPNIEANAKDQTTTDSYKAYTTIVQTIKIK